MTTTTTTNDRPTLDDLELRHGLLLSDGQTVRARDLLDQFGERLAVLEVEVPHELAVAA